MTRETIYTRNREFLPNPVNPLYQTDTELIGTSDHVRDLYDEAVALEDKIAADFDLDELVGKFKINTMAFVKNGLIAFKIKQLKLYKNVCKTFKQFCIEHLGISCWQVNRNIRAAQVVMELIAHGFEQLPRCEAQARALLSATAGDESSVVDAWKSVNENLEPHQITAHTITTHLNPESSKSEPISEKITVKRNLFEKIQTAALAIGMSIEQLLEEIFQPVVENCAGDTSSGGSLQSRALANYYYQEKIEQWQNDVERLTNENRQ